MKKCIKNKETRRFSIFNLQSSICLLIFSMMSLNIMAQDVYVGGSFDGKAAVWKNDTPTVLSTGSGYIFSVVVHKGSVYAAGFEHETVTSCTHKVWKDGVELYAVAAIGNHGWSHSVAISDNGDVYMTGRDGGSYKVWRNGNLTSDLGQWGSVFTSGDDVYLVGTYNHDVHVMKNGELIIVINADTYNLAQKVVVVDDIIYTTVYGSMDGLVWKPKVYKYNTLLYALESTGTGYGLAYDCELGLFVSGNDVYVAGHERNQTTYGTTAKLWINDSDVIDLADGEDPNYAYSVFKYDNDVYVAGTEGLWINGTPTTIDGGARSVFVALPDTLLTITVLADPLMCGTVTGSGVYSYGDVVTVEAIPTDCCTFVHWREGDNLISTDAVYTFTADVSRT
jgi:hypothetical protein